MLIKRADAADKNFACIAGAFGDMDEKGRRNVLRVLEEEMQAGRRRKSAFEVVDRRGRIVMIGQMLQAYGDRWAGDHQDQMDWLAAQRISQAEAIRTAAEWAAERDAEIERMGR